MIALFIILLYLIVVSAIFGILWWGLHKINPQAPFLKVGEVVWVVFVVIVLIYILLAMLPPLPQLFR